MNFKNSQINTNDSTTPSSNKRKHKCNKLAEERLKILRQLAERQQRPHIVKELDANDHFFASITEIVKKLPVKEQAKIRVQIGTIVGNAEIFRTLVKGCIRK
ncbi:hypothetical protein ABEB36_015485 [Hypothenemus hampei]|uniref:BESS domain-containing protein n=1 Tax=Hypothenemus hampei TaxID=57062 RepID=A0ABD1DZT5_HYPHA